MTSCPHIPIHSSQAVCFDRPGRATIGHGTPDTFLEDPPSHMERRYLGGFEQWKQLLNF